MRFYLHVVFQFFADIILFLMILLVELLINFIDLNNWFKILKLRLMVIDLSSPINQLNSSPTSIVELNWSLKKCKIQTRK